MVTGHLERHLEKRGIAPLVGVAILADPEPASLVPSVRVRTGWGQDRWTPDQLLADPS